MKRKRKFLIVEDDYASEILLKMYLEPLNCEILSVKTGNEALEIMENNCDVDIIFMDLRLPGISGWETTALIREKCKDTVIIAQTALAMKEFKEKAMNAGCNCYIPKPLERKVLLSVVDKYLN